MLLVLVFVAIAGCSRGSSPQGPSLPPTAIVTLRPSWALVADSYLRLREDPRADAGIVGHLRFAEVAAITRVSADVVLVEGRAHRWLRLERETVSGWVLDDRVEVFTTEARARDASRRMTEQDQ